MGVTSSGIVLLPKLPFYHTQTIISQLLPWDHWLLGTPPEAFTHHFRCWLGSSLKCLPVVLRCTGISLPSALTRLNFRAFSEAAAIILQHNSQLWIYIYIFNVRFGRKKIYFLLFGAIMHILHCYTRYQLLYWNFAYSKKKRKGSYLIRKQNSPGVLIHFIEGALMISYVWCTCGGNTLEQCTSLPQSRVLWNQADSLSWP